MREFTGYKKGVNLGGWLSQCGNDNYNDGHYSSFIVESDIVKIASWGADHVRLPIDYNVIQEDNGNFIESGFKYIDNCAEWCDKHNLNLILDLHKTAGFSFDEKDNFDFFDNETMQESFINLWREITRRYANISHRTAFELLNEITHRETAEKWNAIAKRTIMAIRETSAHVKILIGGIYNNSIFGLSLLDKPYDGNIVFNFHNYSPLIFTHQKAYWVEKMPKDYSIEYPASLLKYAEESRKIFGNDFDDEFAGCGNENIGSSFFENIFTKAVDISEKYNVPIYCGEYGVIDKAEPEGTLCWFKDIHNAFEKCGIARAVWTYKSKDFGLTDSHYSGIYNELIKYL